MAGPLAGATCAVFGFSNKHSLAWGVAQAWHAAGASLVVGVASDRFRPALERLTEPWGDRRPAIVTADVTDDASLDAAFAAVASSSGGALAAVLHAVAYAPPAALKGPLLDTSRSDWAVAHDVSAYSLVALARRSAPLLAAHPGGGALLTLSFAGSQRAAPGYGVMGPAKASLEAAARALAVELGPSGVRVNVISPGPINTLAARGIPGFTTLRDEWAAKAPLRGHELTAAGDVGGLATFLASPAAAGITGQVLQVDCGRSAVLA